MASESADSTFVALDAFVKAYPNKNASPSRRMRSASAVEERNSRGWGVSDVKFLPAPHNWLRDQHWLKPLPDTPAAPKPVDVEGRALLSECGACGGAVRGVIRDGKPVYDPCPACAEQKAMVS